MCGRFALGVPPKKLAEYFATENVPEYRVRYNVAPTQEIPAVVLEDGHRRFKSFRWGLVPAWAKDPKLGARLINARAETVAEKPAFRTAFKKRRCLIPAQGFYEWKVTDAGREPWFIRRRDGRPMALAGLYEHWEGEGGPIDSCAIVTGDAAGRLQDIHERMPVLIAPEEFDHWLGADRPSPTDILPLLLPFPAEELEMYRVDARVNSPRNDDPGLVAPATKV